MQKIILIFAFEQLKRRLWEWWTKRLFRIAQMEYDEKSCLHEAASAKICAEIVNNLRENLFHK